MPCPVRVPGPGRSTTHSGRQSTKARLCSVRCPSTLAGGPLLDNTRATDAANIEQGSADRPFLQSPPHAVVHSLGCISTGVLVTVLSRAAMDGRAGLRGRCRPGSPYGGGSRVAVHGSVDAGAADAEHLAYLRDGHVLLAVQAPPTMVDTTIVGTGSGRHCSTGQLTRHLTGLAGSATAQGRGPSPAPVAPETWRQPRSLPRAPKPIG